MAVRRIDGTTVPRRPRARGGFSLVSVIFAVALLVVGLLALARSQTLLARAQGTTAIRSRAQEIGRAYMEAVRARPPATLASEGAVRVDSLGRADTQGPFERSLLVDQEAANLLRVRVRVTYPRGVQPVELATLIFR
jgi:type II secretory pathway component PulK